MTISDGFSKIKTFFANESCELVNSGLAKIFSVIEISNAIVNNGEKTLIIILKINVIYEDVPSLIGNPIEFDEYKKNVRKIY